MTKSFTLAPLICTMALLAAAPATAWTTDELQAALDASSRAQADKDRDAFRKPAEVLVYGGVEPGMTVMDVMAAGGWYTEVLSVAVGPEGTVYADNPGWLLEAMNGAPAKALSERLAGNRLTNVKRADRWLEQGLIPAGSIDVVVTALNFHDTYGRAGGEAALNQLRQVYAALKPGGVLILIDHSGKAGMDNAKLHRIEEPLVREMAKEAGFTVAGEGGMLRHPEDDMTTMVFMKDIRGRTDRFVLKLVRPEAS
jgi:predicted methyltransferase